MVVNVRDSGGTLVASATVAVGAGDAGLKTYVPLGFEVPSGTGYRMDAQGTTTGGLFRNTGGAAYPYTGSGVTITGAINGSTTFYYMF